MNELTKWTTADDSSGFQISIWTFQVLISTPHLLLLITVFTIFVRSLSACVHVLLFSLLQIIRDILSRVVSRINHVWTLERNASILIDALTWSSPRIVWAVVVAGWAACIWPIVTLNICRIRIRRPCHSCILPIGIPGRILIISHFFTVFLFFALNFRRIYFW